ncbi:hypothetical protein [Actinomadura sp. BRA 177]|uniref:hypothetical protein n=1 Tax=Actinomadura sp. BRA 177 TaxID=2745202 RepID=UPI001595F50F|nr:hypothetical protein [Actinomadura sp. BRA 177]NVI90423.1 hypothetical protein [Actinomadura sp. BRA 177]
MRISAVTPTPRTELITNHDRLVPAPIAASVTHGDSTTISSTVPRACDPSSRLNSGRGTEDGQASRVRTVLSCVRKISSATSSPPNAAHEEWNTNTQRRSW